MSTEEPHVDAPREPPQPPPAAPPPTDMGAASVIAPSPRGPSTNAILIGVGILAALVLAFFYVSKAHLFAGAPPAQVVAVQPYAPAAPMMTANERVTAYSRPDLSSPPVVVFGQGVALTITGRASRGLGDDWYAISWNNQQAFVRVADAVAGTGAPPTPAEHQVQQPRVKPDEDDDQPEVADNDAPTIPNAPSSSMGLELRDIDWIRAPSARDFARYFPDRALEQGRSGRVVLDCTAAASGRLDCSVASEDPQGLGFGRAALSISRQVRIQPQTSDGRSVAGGHLSLPLNFRAG